MNNVNRFGGKSCGIHRLVMLCMLAALSGVCVALESSSDKAFVAARTAFHKSDSSNLNKAIVALDGHALQPWAQYWRLRLSLDDKLRADDAGIAAAPACRVRRA